MSKYARLRYATNAGAIHPIRISSDAALVVGTTTPLDPPTSKVKVKVSKSNREHGLRPRGIRIYRERPLANSTDVRVDYGFLPILNPGAMTNPEFQPGEEFVYKGNQWTVLEQVEEDF